MVFMMSEVENEIEKDKKTVETAANIIVAGDVVGIYLDDKAGLNGDQRSKSLWLAGTLSPQNSPITFEVTQTRNLTGRSLECAVLQ